MEQLKGHAGTSTFLQNKTKCRIRATLNHFEKTAWRNLVHAGCGAADL